MGTVLHCFGKGRTHLYGRPSWVLLPVLDTGMWLLPCPGLRQPHRDPIWTCCFPSAPLRAEHSQGVMQEGFVSGARGI